MHAYGKWEWRILVSGFFLMASLATLSIFVGLAGLLFENRTVTSAATAALTMAAAAAIGSATVIILQITGRRRRHSYRRRRTRLGNRARDSRWRRQRHSTPAGHRDVRSAGRYRERSRLWARRW